MYNLLESNAVKNGTVDGIRLINIYRYLSLLFTSLIYLTGKYKAPMVDKLMVIACMTIAVILLNYIYSRNKDELNIIKVLIIIESIGSILILLPTGGLNSPYVWYSLNPVLVTAFYLSLNYFCINVAIYVISSVVISFAIFNISGRSLISYLIDNSNLVTSYFLIVIAIQSLMSLAKKLREESTRLFLANNELTRANKINELLLRAEEQNRIANEIHDSVSQRLFYVSSKLHSLSEKEELNKTSSIKNELRLVQDSLTSAMQELREVIYSYSDKRSGLSKFEEKIRNYLNEVSRLNDVNIKLDSAGSMEVISYEFKKVLYRILCEALGNAIRHGKSRNIDVRLAIGRESISLEISDDGIGFDLRDKSNAGLGIKNLNNLVHSFGGEIIIKSQLCKGTCIDIELPPETVIKKEQVKVI